MPEDGKHILKFVNHHKQMRVPFIIYADFKSLNIPVEGCVNDPQKSHTHQIAKQVPRSYCYAVVRSDGVAKAPVLYRNENAVEHFLASLQDQLTEITEVFRKPVDMIMAANNHRVFADATDCHICGEERGEKPLPHHRKVSRGSPQRV